MQNRRFGRTEIQMPVITCGGMRYQQSWDDLDYSEVKPDVQKNVEETIQRSFDLGITHIETARAYGTSEVQLGNILNKYDRESYILQSKVMPYEDPNKFTEALEKTYANLQTDYLDLFSFHGINNPEIRDRVMRKGGYLDQIRQYQKDGRIKHVGFSTHAYCDDIVKSIETDEFDYVNLHWYYINQLNWKAIQAATKRDMGVFIISPNDKGGQLYKPSQKLLEICQPLHPMIFNDLFCLNRPEVHTLSIGVSKPSDFDEHIEALQYYENIEETLQPILERLENHMETVLGKDYWSRCYEGIPEWDKVPGEINILYIIRLWNLAKALDMHEFGKYRYGMIGNGDHWMAGNKAVELEKHDLTECLKNSPFADTIPAKLKEANEWFKAAEERKPLTSS